MCQCGACEEPHAQDSSIFTVAAARLKAGLVVKPCYCGN